MIVGFSGHRPSTLPGASRVPPDELDRRLTAFATGAISNMLLGCTEIISGMAEGWDLAVAEAAINLGLPFTAAIPFEGQERLWSGKSQMRYRWLRAQAKSEIVVGPFPDKAFYWQRDKWIVDSSDAMMVLCGKKDGGTYRTMVYAQDWGLLTVNVWSLWINRNQ